MISKKKEGKMITDSAGIIELMGFSLKWLEKNLRFILH